MSHEASNGEKGKPEEIRTAQGEARLSVPVFMSLLTTILAGACLLGGAFFMLAAAVGIIRLPDVLCRSHALAKAMTLGIILMLSGLWLHLGGEEGFSGLKITLAVFFQLLTVPVASHLLSLLAWEKNLPRWRHRPVADHRQPSPPASPPANRAD